MEIYSGADEREKIPFMHEPISTNSIRSCLADRTSNPYISTQFYSMKHLYLLVFLVVSNCAWSQQNTSLIGIATSSAPYFRYVDTFNHDDEVVIGIDPLAIPIVGIAVDVYVVVDQSAEAWQSSSELIDVRPSGAQQVTFTGTSIAESTAILDESSLLDNFSGARPGASFDLVIDVNQNGELDSEDYIDGLEESGFFMVGNMFDPGPYAVDTTHHSSSFWNTFDVFYPTNIQELGEQPLVVISHGWTHEYTFYNYLGYHLASYGYVVISHRNEVGNGGALATETASQTALQNIDEFFTVQNDLAGGLLTGKVNKNLIIHTGHSTGGECVVRAYKRLFDGDYVSPFITHESIVCVASMAPVAFLSPEQTNPLGANYHQFLCGADTDVSGWPADSYTQPFSIYERGYGNKQVTYIHGAGHSDLHGAEDFPWADGPDLIGKEATHTIVKPYFLALCELYSRNNLAVKEYFTRTRQSFRPSNISSELTISGEYRDAEGLNYVIDDFQTYPDEHLSSSGHAVTWNMEAYQEILMQDIDESFSWTGENWSNGMTRARYDDDPKCVTFEWNDNVYIEFVVGAEIMDWSELQYLSFRACQLTRHPFNADSEGLTFDMTVEDTFGNTSSINLGAYGPVIPTYPKSSGGLLELCLEEGEYTVVVGGSQFEVEMGFSIDGYIDNGLAGITPLQIGPGDPCTIVQVVMTDTWGDGWDEGLLQILDSEGNVMGEGTLSNGFTSAQEVGWQNEFHTYRIDVDEFLLGGTNVDLNSISRIYFEFGEDHGSSQGALALDDLELVNGGLSFIAQVENSENNVGELLIYPNPTNSNFTIKPAAGKNNWSFEVFNMQGQKVMSKDNIGKSAHTVSTGQLATGIYLVLVREGEATSANRVVVMD
ncbi:MAG: hypothetical protein ACI84C_001426 [Flavobacteriales bacterium]